MDGHPLRRIRPGEDPSPRGRLFDAQVDAVAAKAIFEVREEGLPALRRWAESLGELEPGSPFLIPREGLREAWEGLEPATRALLERAKGRIAAFAAAQRSCLSDLNFKVPGGRAGHVFVPVSRVGCYVPGGRYSLPSTALMTVVPAVVAGVGEVWCAGPKPGRASLGAAYIAGAMGFLACGGAHAVAALAFGVGLPRCDMIVGPGGRYVATAKRQLFGVVGTEAPAGPSELLIVADDGADPDKAAADLLAQAEHDTAAFPAIICSSEAFAFALEARLIARLALLPEPNRSVASAALGNGWLLVEANPAKAMAFAELTSPEHLELQVSDPAAYTAGIQSAGAVFLGSISAEVFGDYGAGPNHTLPTGGAARFASGLSVLNFLRARTWLEMDDPEPLAGDTADFARLEGLEAHARAAEARLQPQVPRSE
ncbi:MAG: histidinol dehydrogenase [Spirochaetes bacterium]|nr:histidinol dehydrogenase [Spirochaetota bacterium]